MLPIAKEETVQKDQRDRKDQPKERKKDYCPSCGRVCRGSSTGTCLKCGTKMVG